MRYADSHCTHVENFKPEHTYTFTGPCKVTGKPYSVTVKAAGLYKYRQGALIQHAFPTLSANDREFLMSGYSPEGWRQVFGSDDVGEDEQEFDEDEV